MNKIFYYFLIALFILPLIYAQDLPVLPAIYYGTISTPCNLNGTKLQAYINNELKGEIEIFCSSNTFCKFGGPSLYEDKLIVQGTKTENNTALVEFYVYTNGNRIKIGEDIFISGQIKSLRFVLTQDQCNILFESSSSSSQEKPPETTNTTSEESLTTGANTSGGISSGGFSMGESNIIPTQNITDIIIKKLEQEGIKEVIEKIIPLQNITDVKISRNITFKERPTIEKVSKANNIKSKIERKLEEALKTNIKLNIEFPEVEVVTKIIKIETKSGKKTYFTKVEKIVKATRIIEVIPKDLAKTADRVIWVRGKVLRILERDPIFEVAPEDSKIMYLITGNKTEEVKSTLTLTYSYETYGTRKEEEVIPFHTNNISSQESKENQTIAKSEQTIPPTKEAGEKIVKSYAEKIENGKLDMFMIIGLISLSISGILYFVAKIKYF